MDRFSARTVDSGPISDHFGCFWPDLKIRAGPKLGLGPTFKSGLGQGLAQDPQPGLPILERFSGPHSGTFFCKFFVAFPGNSSNHVDPADPTKFVAFPGNSTNNVDKKPDLAFRNRQAWLGMTWLSCNLHSRPLTKYFPPMEAATAADLAQAFEPVLRRLRQQPT